MFNKTLTEILVTFSDKDIGRFTDMLNSPYFNKRQSLSLFWGELQRSHPHYKIDKDELYQKVFPGKPYNYGTMKNLIHELTIFAEKFIGMELHNEIEFERSANMLNGLLIRDLNSLFLKRFRKVSDLLDKNSSDYDHHQKRYKAEALKQNYLLSNDKYHGRYKDAAKTFSHLTQAYFIDLFINQYNIALMKSELNAAEYPMKYMDEALRFYKSMSIEKDFVTEIYYNAFMLVYTEEEPYYFALKKLLADNSANMKAEEQYNFYIALSNFCIKKINTNSPGYKEEQFSIYKYMIDNRLYSINVIDKMDGNFYRNAAAAAAACGKFEWAEKFIEEYRPMLDTKVSDNYYNHALVELYISEKQWDKAASSLAMIKHTNLSDKFNLKRWQMIIFFEHGNLEELRYLIDSTKHFLSKDKTLAESYKIRFKLFTDVMNSLVVITQTDDKKEKEWLVSSLKKELSNNQLSQKEWFREKLAEMASK